MTSTKMRQGDGKGAGSQGAQRGLGNQGGQRGAVKRAVVGLSLRQRTVALRAPLARVLDRYPPLGPALEGPWSRAAFGFVVAVTLIYIAFFSLLLFATQDAFLTHAEDMGIMQQALWNTTHGAFMHQTICDLINDTNCIGDVSRFAIHFEPIMVPLALLYRLIPSAKLLQFVQVAVVASGALPAYWLASRRLRSPLAGVVFALAYLLFPALESAMTFDFHAVTLAAAFLLFALYFMMTRNDVGLVVMCLLAMATKENIPLDVIMIGLSVVFLQRRPRLGWRLVGMACAWLVVELLIMKVASPLGHSPTASRFSALGDSPVQAAAFLIFHPIQVLKDYVFEPGRFYYVRTLLSPVAYLPILSPLTLLIAVPTLAINMLSSDPSMYSGIYQYNADVVPVLIFAAIESVALIEWAARGFAARTQVWATETPAVSAPVTPARAGNVDLLQSLQSLSARGIAARDWGRRWLAPRVAPGTERPRQAHRVGRVVMLATLVLVFGMSLREQHAQGYTPFANGFSWPQVTAHDALGDQIAAMIPQQASVSVQSDLAPHVANRRLVYLFPNKFEDADYLFLDVTGNIYPLLDSPPYYFTLVQDALVDGQYHVVVAQDGYLLLAHGPAKGAPADTEGPYNLPAAFYTFTVTPRGQVPHPIKPVRYGNTLELVGYNVSPAPTVYLQQAWLTVTAYFTVTAPIQENMIPQLLIYFPDGHVDSHITSPVFAMLPTSDWQVGKTYAVTIDHFFINNIDLGTMHIGAKVLGSSGALPVAPPAGTPTSAVSDHGTVYLFATEVGAP